MHGLLTFAKVCTNCAVGGYRNQVLKSGSLLRYNRTQTSYFASTTETIPPQDQPIKSVDSGRRDRKKLQSSDGYSGFGKRMLKHGNVYEGDWVDGRISGYGQMAIKPNVTARVGAVKDFLRANGQFAYDGEWLNGKQHGMGRMVFVNGSICEGEFRNGHIYNGKGVVMKSKGRLYDGEIQEGLAHGQGKMSYGDGRTLEGLFHKGNIVNGKGALLFPSVGTIQEGVWVGGKRNGPGRTIYGDNSMLVGEFRDNKIFHGRGTLKARDGTVSEGTWENGFMVGTGKITYPDGSTLVGEFHVDVVHSGADKNS